MRQLYKYRELLWIWIWREIRARYKQSILGGLWAILQPLVLMVIFSVIFSRFLQVPTEGIPYPIFYYSALLFWMFFSTSITFGANSLINNMGLLRKIYFPREIIPLAAVGASLVDFCLASTVFMGLMAYYHVPITSSLLWVGPLLVLQTLLIIGVVLIVSALNVFYRDLRFVVPLGIQIWMYATPIIYPVSLVPEPLRAYLVLNPMVGVIEGYRSSILHGVTPDWSIVWPGAMVALAIFIIGIFVFKRLEWQFADVI